MTQIVAGGDEDRIGEILAEDVRFLPPTHWASWTGRDPVAKLLGHVGGLFRDFRYRRVRGAGRDRALDSRCRVGDLDAVGVDRVTLDEDGLIAILEVAMRPQRSAGALRAAMEARLRADPRFAGFRKALS